MTPLWERLAEPARERLFAFMRSLDAAADDYFRKGRETPNTIPVGAALFDETLRGAVRFELVMALRVATSLDDAQARASKAVRLWVEKHNARRPDINWKRWTEAGQDELVRLVDRTEKEILGS